LARSAEVAGAGLPEDKEESVGVQANSRFSSRRPTKSAESSITDTTALADRIGAEAPGADWNHWRATARSVRASVRASGCVGVHLLLSKTL